jgi:hypothetical protein
MSDSNRVQVGIIEEVTPGLTPATPAFETLRITGTPSLAFEPLTVVTNEIRADRQITDLIPVGAEAGGDIGYELSKGALDTVLQGALFDSWVERNNRKGSDITGIASNIITILTGTAFAAGNLIGLDRFGDANDGVVFVAVATTDATTITAGAGLTDNASPSAQAEIYNVGEAAVTGDVAAAISPNRLTSTILDFETLGLSVGQWVKIGGQAGGNKFVTTELNDYCRISAISPTALEFDVVPTGWAVDAGAGQDIWLFFGDYLRNGTTLKQYSIERSFLDHAPVTYEVFTGMGIGVFNLALAPQSIVTATTTFIGFNSTLSNTRTAGATDVPAPANSVMNTSSNVARIGRRTGQIVGPNFVLNASINMDNGLRRQNAVANFGAIGVGTGEFNVTGNLESYFGDKSLLDDVIAGAESSFDLIFRDALLKTVIFDIPRIKFSQGSAPVPGKNQDVLQTLAYQGLRHTVLGYTLQVMRFHATQ